MQKTLENIQLRLILSRKRSNNLSLTHVVKFSLLSEALMTQKKWCRAHSAGFKLPKTAKTHQKQKKGHFRGIFGEITPFFGPENCVFEIALVILVEVGTYEKILRPTKNPTLAGMDPLPRVYPPSVTIPAALIPQTRSKSKSRATTTPHKILWEENDYSPPRVEVDPLTPVLPPMHKHPNRY